jgi:Aerotolerance regulator N-terminal/von Willebrand factor type A domain
MGFLSPWFLAGAAAVGLPIYLHLLRRHSTTPHPFSSLMFFEQRMQSSIKHRRLRYLVLLALRTALLLLLALAFADPFINRPAASISGDTLLLLVVDNSFSMRAGTRLADARREALAVLAARPAAERAQVMTLGSRVRVLTQPTQDSGALRAAVENIQPGYSHAAFGELAHTLRSIAESTPTPLEVHLFSDMQKSSLPANFSDLTLPANVLLVPHAVVTAAAPNWTVESVTAPSTVADPKKAHVEAVIAGFDTPATTRSVSLVVNGKTVATHTVQVPASGRATVDFASLDVPYGFSRCEVRLDSADSFPDDDASRFAVERSDPEPVLFVYEAQDTRSPLYFGDALASAAEASFTLAPVTSDRVANVQPSRYAFVVLSDVLSLPGSFQEALEKYVRGGGSVLIAAGTSSAHRSQIPVIGDHILGSRYYSREGQSFLTVGDADPSYPSLEGTARWAGVKFYFVVQVAPGDSRVLARLTDQTPLLLERRIGEGQVLLLTSGLDNLTNDFPLQPAFVPFVEQTSRYLAGVERRNGSRLVDSYLQLRTARERSVSVQVTDPAGRHPLSLQQAATAQSFQLTSAGFYQLHLADGREDMVGVNPDPRESDLNVVPKDVLALWSGKGNEGTQRAQLASVAGTAQQQTRPYTLWWYLLLLALITAVAESLLASQYLSTRREEL